MFNIFKIFKNKNKNENSYLKNTYTYKNSTFKEPFYREPALTEKQPDINDTRSYTSTVTEKGNVDNNKQLSDKVSTNSKLYSTPISLPSEGIRYRTKIPNASANNYRCYIGSRLQCRTTINSIWIYTEHNELLHRIDNYKDIIGNYNYSNAECRIVELNEQEIEFLFNIKNKGPTNIVSKDINNSTKVSVVEGKLNKDKISQQKINFCGQTYTFEKFSNEFCEGNESQALCVLDTLIKQGRASWLHKSQKNTYKSEKEKQPVSSISKIRIDIVNQQYSAKTVANRFNSDIAKIRRYDNNSENINIQSSSGYNYNALGDYEIDGGYDEYGYDEDMNGAYD